MNHKSVKVLLLILLVLVIDQSVKIWVKTHMHYGEEIELFGLSWALIHFVENNGMAFGLTLGGDYGKLTLSLFRILAVAFLIYYIRQLIRAGASFGLLASFGLILAGALGNILDSAFYGVIFSESTYHGGVARMFPDEGGYAGFLHGRVVDMLYFPVFQGYFPSWVPFWGGEYFLFFKPVFNVADMAITFGVLNILFFQRHFFKTIEEEKAATTESEPSPAAEEADPSAAVSDQEKMTGEPLPEEEEDLPPKET